MVFSASPLSRLARCVALAFALAGAAQATPITVGIPEPLKIDYAFLSFADKLGYFREEGLEPQILSLDGSGVLIPQVAARRIDVAFVNPGLLVIAASKGQPFPVKYFYNHYRSQVFQIVTKADGPIRTLADLKGKRFGVPFLAGGDVPLAKLILAESGVDWAGLEVLPTGFGPAAWKRVANNEVDAVIFPIAEAERLALSGTPVRRLELPQPFPRLFANGFIASDETLSANPALAVKFGRAVAKGTTACIANVDACLLAYWERDPKLKNSGLQQDAWLKESRQLLNAIFAGAYRLQPGQPDLWGNYPADAWKQLVSTMRAGGQIPNESVDLNLLYTTSFVADINRFDRQLVRQQSGAKP